MNINLTYDRKLYKRHSTPIKIKCVKMLYVLSATYDATLNGLDLKLYNDETEKIEDWIDIDYKPYFLAKDELTDALKGVVKKEIVSKYDALNDKNVDLWK